MTDAQFHYHMKLFAWRAFVTLPLIVLWLPVLAMIVVFEGMAGMEIGLGWKWLNWVEGTWIKKPKEE